MYMQSQTVQDLQLSRLNQAAPVIQQHLHLVPLELQQLMWQQVCSPIPKVTVILRPLSLTGRRNPAEADTSPVQVGINLFLVGTRQVAVIFNPARLATSWVNMGIKPTKVTTRMRPFFQQLLIQSATNSFKTKSQ